MRRKSERLESRAARIMGSGTDWSMVKACRVRWLEPDVWAIGFTKRRDCAHAWILSPLLLVRCGEDMGASTTVGVWQWPFVCIIGEATSGTRWIIRPFCSPEAVTPILCVMPRPLLVPGTALVVGWHDLNLREPTLVLRTKLEMGAISYFAIVADRCLPSMRRQSVFCLMMLLKQVLINIAS